MHKERGGHREPGIQEGYTSCYYKGRVQIKLMIKVEDITDEVNAFVSV